LLTQNNPQLRLVVSQVAKSSYADLFEQAWGPGSLDYTKDVAGTYDRIAISIAFYERSLEVNPFTSKYDYYLEGKAVLTEQVTWGLELLEGKAMCSACHLSRPEPIEDSDPPAVRPPLFTDFTFDNLGIPKNLMNPFYHAMPDVNPVGPE
jgi:cytochrome c peroxidase